MTESSFIIRHEEVADREFVYQVELDAFGQDNEARLVEALHEAGHVVLSLVAVVEDEVVGHILFSPMLVGTELDTNVAICLGPMAIAPAYQSQGVGTQMVETALDELRRFVNTAVFLVGHPTFYQRFGFGPAREFDVHYEDDRDAFMALELTPGALKYISGDARFAPEFDLFAGHS